MERISTLLDKIEKLNKNSDVTVIDLDLMIDYVKVMYADLLEWRTRMVFTGDLKLPKHSADTDKIISSFQIKDEPSLDEMTEAFEKELLSDEKPDLSPTPLPEQSTHHLSQPARESIKTDTYRADISSFKTKDDIRKFVGINEKFVFINELFGGDKGAYEKTLSDLSNFNNSEDAIEWLQNTFSKSYGWKEDDFNVQDFFRVLEGYYKRNSFS